MLGPARAEQAEWTAGHTRTGPRTTSPPRLRVNMTCVFDIRDELIFDHVVLGLYQNFLCLTSSTALAVPKVKIQYNS